MSHKIFSLLILLPFYLHDKKNLDWNVFSNIITNSKKIERRNEVLSLCLFFCRLHILYFIRFRTSIYCFIMTVTCIQKVIIAEAICCHQTYTILIFTLTINILFKILLSDYMTSESCYFSYKKLNMVRKISSGYFTFTIPLNFREKLHQFCIWWKKCIIQSTYPSVNLMSKTSL